MQAEIITWVKYGILTRVYSKGDFLPPARELATFFDVNPNTVRAALGYLQELGLVESQRGVGTFVTTEVPQERSDQLKRLLKEMAREGKELGLTTEELATLISNWSPANLQGPQIWYIDVFNPSFDDFAAALSEKLQEEVHTLCFDDVEEQMFSDAGPASGDIIFTSEFAAERVSQMFGHPQTKLFPLPVRLAPQTLESLRHQPAQTKMGIVCIEDRFARISGKVLAKKGIPFQQQYGNLVEREKLSDLYKWADVIVISNKALNVLSTSGGYLPEVSVVPIWYEPEPGRLEGAVRVAKQLHQTAS